MGFSTIAKIVKETCSILYETLQPLYMENLTDSSSWMLIAQGFKEKWQFPNCLGAIDGKHIRIKAPPKCGSLYYNYKGYHSFVLMGVCDANGKLLIIDVGAYGSCSDGGIFRNSSFVQALRNNLLELPDAVEDPFIQFPYVFVGDEAFPLLKNLMKPFPQRDLDFAKRIFNYRLSRARRQIECTFGIMSNMWRVLHTELETNIKTSCSIVKAICVLHKFLISKNVVSVDQTIETDMFTEDEPFINDTGNRASNGAITIRNAIKTYFVSPQGSVQWQNDMV